MIGTAWLPLLIRDGKKIDRWVQQAITLFEESKDLQGKARATEIMALIARHRGEIARTIELIDEAWVLLDASGIDDEVSRARLTLLRIDTALLQANLTDASAMSARFLHRTRHNRWLSILASLAACDRDLLEGNLDRLHHRLDEIDEIIGEDQNGKPIYIEGILPGVLTLGSHHFNENNLGSDFFDIDLDTSAYYASELTVQVIQSNFNTTEGMYKPIRGTFEGIGHSYPWSNGQPPADTIAFSGEFCLNGFIN
jgi:hypothetical protein